MLELVQAEVTQDVDERPGADAAVAARLIVITPKAKPIFTLAIRLRRPTAACVDRFRRLSARFRPSAIPPPVIAR
jgi:hypothetical protein